MKRVVIFIFGTFIISGCTPKSAGYDSAYLNRTRGASGAQITASEAQQYHRQQALTADEIRLENMKRRQTTDAIQEGASAVSSTADAIKDGVGAIRTIKGLFY
ncbi:MAG: hypothetical protein GXO06_01865 [Epsilonproteobacteria bacterium]|nr:hypothetical protein [Campylobacterota bacterium]